VTNVVRHARARRLDVALDATGDSLGLVVRDDGIGFPPQSPGAPAEAHLGLLGMQERAQLVGGDVHIESRPGAGTLVRARFPLPDRHDVA
jgi:signal transduction histidine kinase